MSRDNSEIRAAQAVARAQRIAHLLDTAYTLPGTSIRFGWDAIAGLIPGVGDTLTLFVGLYPLIAGLRFGLPKRMLAKMVLRLALDWLIGLVPLVDLVFDVGYKANARNARDLARELER